MKTNKTQSKLIVGNWKMNLTVHEASVLLHQLMYALPASKMERVDVAVAPPMIALQSLHMQAEYSKIKLAAQNFHWRDHGSVTGEVSAWQLRGIAAYGIVGHSARAQFGETMTTSALKVQAALRNHITPILCVGETAEQHHRDDALQIIQQQVKAGLAHVTADEASSVIIAYKPIWAVGSGRVAMPSDIARVIAGIRDQVADLFGRQAAAALRVLYGGSVTTEVVRPLLSVPGVDGLLIGAASRKPAEFIRIVETANEASQEGGKDD